MKFSYYLIFFCCSLLLGCSKSKPEVNQPTIQPAILPNPSSTKARILFFKKENTMEIWTNEAPFKQIASFQPTFKPDSLSIGQYDRQTFINAPFLKNIPYKYQFEKLLIFPNDGRTTGFLTPCFACPHHKAAIYAQLELSMNDYLLKNKARFIN